MPRAPRVLQACQECRTRKIRCSGSKPRCQACVDHRRLCHWPEKPAPGSYRAVSVGRGQELEGGPGQVDADPNGGYGFAHPGGPTAQRPDITGRLPGPSELPSSSTQVASRDLPPPFLLQRLLDIFTERHHSIELCGCIDKDAFQAGASPEQNDIDPSSVNVLYSVLSVSSLYLTDEEASMDRRFASAFSLSKYYSSKASKASRQLSEEPSVSSIQMNLCLSLRGLLVASASCAWLYAGLAIRLAQALRMRMEYNQRHAPRQREIRRRTFWACVVMDRLVAYCTFRTQTINPSLITIHLPCSDVSFAFEDSAVGPRLDELGVAGVNGNGGQKEQQQKQQAHGLMPYFIKTVILWGYIASEYVDVGRRNFELPPRDPASQYWKHEQAMLAWRSALPPSLQWTTRNFRAYRALGQASLFTQMHFLIAHSLCVVHQEYLPQIHDDEGDSESNAEAKDRAGISLAEADPQTISLCLAGAQQIVDMTRLVSGQVVNPSTTRGATFSIVFSNAALTAGSILTWCVRARQKISLPAGPVPTASLDPDQASLDAEYLMSTLESTPRLLDLAHTWAKALKLVEKFYCYQYSLQAPQETADAGNCNDERVTEESVCPLAARDNRFVSSFKGQLKSGDGLPDLSMLPKGLYYKVRLITGVAMELTERMYRNFLRKRKRPREDSQEHDANFSTPYSSSDQQLENEFWALEPDLSWLMDLELDAPFFWTSFSNP